MCRQSTAVVVSLMPVSMMTERVGVAARAPPPAARSHRARASAYPRSPAGPRRSAPGRRVASRPGAGLQAGEALGLQHPNEGPADDRFVVDDETPRRAVRLATRRLALSCGYLGRRSPRAAPAARRYIAMVGRMASNVNRRKAVNSFRREGHVEGRRADVRDFPAARTRGKGTRGRPAAVLPAHPAGEPAAHRGRRHRHGRRHRGAGRAGTRKADPDREIAFTPAASCCRTSPASPPSSTWPPCATRWPSWAATRRRSTRSSRWSWSSTTRCRWTSSARREAFRHERRAGVRAQPRALRLPPLGPAGVRQLPRRPARHRHRAPGQPGIPGARRVHHRREPPTRREPVAGLSRHAASAPTRTRRWSTAWACWAGASAASRPRPPCWASRSRC